MSCRPVAIFFCNLFKLRLQGVAFLERDRNASSQPPPGEIKHITDEAIHPGDAGGDVREHPLLALGCCLTFQ